MTRCIFVTGGAGYIGSHACKELSRAGYLPVAIDCLITGWSKAVKFGPLELVNLTDRNAIKKIFEKYNPEAVMHFAGLSQVSESVRLPGNYWHNNVVGSLNLIEEAVEHNCLDFIFSSTCATYGEYDGIFAFGGYGTVSCQSLWLLKEPLKKSYNIFR